MDAFFQWLSGSFAATIALLIFLGTLVTIYAVAFAQGREISFWPPKIGAKPDKEINSQKGGSEETGSAKDEEASRIPRVSVMASTTEEIENDPVKTEALKKFYEQFLYEIERLHIGLNFCGAEPFREVIALDYGHKLRTHTKSQMRAIDKRIRWYWYEGDREGKGFNFEPAFYTSCKAEDGIQRTIMEITDANIVVAFTGGAGTLGIVQSLIQYHNDGQQDIDLNKKPLILLGWFGGAVRKYINDNRRGIAWLLQKYPELNPAEEIEDWYEGEIPIRLAEQLAGTIKRLIS
jgi:hypothetical protein